MNIDKMLSELIRACGNMAHADDQESIEFENKVALEFVSKIKERDKVILEALKHIAFVNDIDSYETAQRALKEIGEEE